MMKRTMLIGVMMSFVPMLHLAEAAEGAWCFSGNYIVSGPHTCQFASFEQCRRAAGRGFCTQNPRWPRQQGAQRRSRR
jgi:hypothetical protein